MKMRLCAFGLALAVCVPTMVQSEPLKLNSKSRTGVFKSQLAVLDNRAASQYSGSIRLQPPRAIVPGTPEAMALSAGYTGPYLELAKAAAGRHDIPSTLFLKLVQQESGWNPSAVSNKGAIGLAQLMPATARKLRVNAYDPAQNLEGGARYLRQQFDRFGSWRLALAAYNAGPGAVLKYNGIPPYAETKNYVRRIHGR